ncbi:type II toxin-antitoxin system VapC family toxin [Knoellia sp. CPCC 206453]|uniref:type II toxin-antitoxin system VapC family toxin n=1 Tax=Knoellia pratensis TaxID=3404796 RepID=UPI0036182B10
MILDTNALLWLLEDDPALGQEARQHIGTRRVWFSAVSITEATTKSALGKLRNADPLAGALAAGLTELALSAKHGMAIANFPTLLKHDPFDRMLLAQAHVEGLPLLTSDRVLLAAAPDLTIDARA